MKKILYSSCDTIRAENISFSALINSFDFSCQTDDVSNDIISQITHSHSYTELFICFDTGIMIKTEYSDIYLNPGELLIIPPGIKHVMLPNKAEGISIGFSYYKLKRQYSHDFYRQIEKLSNVEKPCIICKNYSLQIKQLLEITEFETLKVMRILELLLSIAHHKAFDAKSIGTVGNVAEKDIDRASRLDELFCCSFMDNISADDAAKKLHISKRQLDRIAHNRFGMPFHAVKTEYRLKAACKMLAETELCAESIGYAVGYNNKSAFYSAFKKKYGTTPLKFRNMTK